jgi:Tfp pilus assembly protein PilF
MMKRQFALALMAATMVVALGPARAGRLDINPDAPTQSDVDHCNKGADDVSACGRILRCATAAARTTFCAKLPAATLATMFVNRGAAYFHRHDYVHAMDDDNKAISLDATNYVAFVGLGHAYRETGDPDRALVNFNEAIRLSPSNGSNYHARGLVFLDKADYDRAIADFSRAIELKPESIKPWSNRGVAYLRKGDFAHARADFEKALTLTPQDDNDRSGQDRARKELADLNATSHPKFGFFSTPSPATPVTVAPPPPPVTVVPPPSPPPVAVVSPPHSTVVTPAERRIALVIGNSAYQNVRRLDNPGNDARLMANTLRALGFTLIGGGPQLDLDKAGLDRMAQAFGRELRGANVGLLYYAGHGVQVDGENYLVPVDANPTSKADVDFQMTNVQLVLRQMELSGTRLNLVILDACRNNPFGGRGLRDAGNGLAQMHAPRGTLIGFATAPGTVAQDGSDGNSPYAKALAASMRRPGLGLFDTFNTVAVAPSLLAQS